MVSIPNMDIPNIRIPPRVQRRGEIDHWGEGMRDRVPPQHDIQVHHQFVQFLVPVVCHYLHLHQDIRTN